MGNRAAAALSAARKLSAFGVGEAGAAARSPEPRVHTPLGARGRHGGCTRLACRSRGRHAWLLARPAHGAHTRCSVH